MSDRMTPISFPDLMTQIITEKQRHDTVFGVRRAYHAAPNRGRELFGKPLEMPFGPAAGPHTQLAQNLVAAYYAGSRFFELKTPARKYRVQNEPVKECDGGHRLERI